MKPLKIVYWVSTSLVSLMMIRAVIGYLTDPKSDEAFHHLGFPSYFRIELAVAKLIGVVVLVVPLRAGWSWLKEWAYAGFVIVFISAIIAQTASGHPVVIWLIPFVVLVIHLASYVTYRMIQTKRNRDHRQSHH